MQDSVNVEISVESNDTSYSIGSKYLKSFAFVDSIVFNWSPNTGGLYTLTAKINQPNDIDEMDYSDNTTSNAFIVFNISDPSILKPIDGYASANSEIEFVISDVGYYVKKDLKYIIEIDTSMEFVNPIKYLVN